MPNGLTLQDVPVDSGNLVSQFGSALLIVGLPVPLYQIEELVSKFVVEDEFKPFSDIVSPLNGDNLNR